MLYDKKQSAPAALPVGDVTAADVESFCQAWGLSFEWLGDETGTGSRVFRVGTRDFPAQGLTVTLDKVREWKRAKAAIGSRVLSGGVYRHFKGGRYTTVCEATDEKTGMPVVVYRGEDGRVWTRPTEQFFCVTARPDGELVARFALEGQA